MIRLEYTVALVAALALLAGPALAQTPAAPPAEAPPEAEPTPEEAADAPEQAAEAPEAVDPPAESAPEAASAAPDVAEAPAPGAAEASAGSAPNAAPSGPAASARSTPRRPVRRDDDIHLTMRWGMRVQLDPAFDALGDDRSQFSAEIGIDVRIWRALAGGLSFAGVSEQDQLYDRQTLWRDNTLFLSAVYRHRFRDLGLSAYGRLGPTVHWYHLVIGDDLAADERFEDDPWQFGARAAAGLEFWPISPAFIPDMGRFGVGLVLEGYYDQSFQTQWSSGGVDPGEFDPSGPGWSLGLTTRF